MNEDYHKFIDDLNKKAKPEDIQSALAIAAVSYPLLITYQDIKNQTSMKHANEFLSNIIASLLLDNAKNFDEALTSNKEIHERVRQLITKMDKDYNTNGE